MLWLFDSAIKRGAKKGVDDFLASDRFKQMIDQKAREIVAEEVAKVPHWNFLKQIQWKIHSADPGMADRDSFNRAKRVLRQHLIDEKIEFGDPRFGWSQADAHDLAQAYEIDHWEARP